MEKTVIDWFEELRGLDAVQAGEVIFSELRNRREHDVKMLAYALTAWAMLAKEEEKRVQ
jgi:hypothetical protein